MTFEDGLMAALQPIKPITAALDADFIHGNRGIDPRAERGMRIGDHVALRPNVLTWRTSPEVAVFVLTKVLPGCPMLSSLLVSREAGLADAISGCASAKP